MQKRLVSLVLGLGLALAGPVHAAPLGTAFTYQGQLLKNGAPHTGAGDFLFRLYDDPGAGNQVGADVSLAGVPVTGGLFTVDLDFGPVFDGTALWLEIQVQTPGDAGYTALAPRQPLTASPYALHALSAPGGGGGSQWTNDVNGISYSAGNVGVGAVAHPGNRVRIAGGADNLVPLHVTTSNPGYAALYVANTANDGYGLYDDLSDRHYLAGYLGINVLAPTASIHVDTPLARSINAVSTGNPADALACAIRAAGVTPAPPSFGAPAMGLVASSVDQRGIYGFSTNHIGVEGVNSTASTSGALGTPNEGVYGYSPTSDRPAARFNVVAGGVAIEANGLAKVKTLQILGADLAESFPAREGEAEPGTVMVIGGGAEGELHVADEPYSRRVAGVVSGASGLDAGVILKGHSFDAEGRVAVALSGRVWVKCDATAAPIRVGDLLTTSTTPGHAMVAADRDRAYGAVLGKAMTSLEGGHGLVLVLVNLQ